MMRKLPGIFALLTAACSVGCFSLWLIGKLVSDRWYLTQYLSWMPTPAVLAAMAVASLGLAILARFNTPAGKGTMRVRWALWVLNAVVLAALLLEWKTWRYIAPVRAPEGMPTFRLMHWNPAVDFMDDFAQRVVAKKPQFIAITNRPAYTDWVALQDQVGGTRSMARFGHLSLVSSCRITRWGGTKLGIKDARKRTTLWAGGGEVSQDQGQAFFAQLDTTATLGRPLTLWIIDIPSDPGLSRDTMFRQAAATLAAYTGRSYTRSVLNLDVEDDAATAKPGFPQPDIIVGDFNTPRGSASITHVTGGLRHAYDLAGRGWCPTWRRDYPLISIDQTFLAPWLNAAHYSGVDMGAGWHRAQITDLYPAQ